MDNQVWDTDFNYNGPQTVKVSCHVGDFGQRAICNMIGDQPLFYIEDSAEEDFSLEELLMVDGLSARDEKMLDEMRAKMKAYDKSAQLLSEMKITELDEHFNAFLNDTVAKTTLEDVLSFANQSGTFKSYYDFVIKAGITLSLDNTIETSFYDTKLKTILINPNMDVQNATISTLKAMRLVWLQKQGALINPLAFQPEQAILINRMIAADNEIISIAMMWDMKLAGFEDMWNHAMAGSNYDLCSAYAMEAMTDFRAIKSGLALRATFEKWFISGRCKSEDRKIIQTMMGKHTDIQINHEDTSRTVALDVISAMGRRPHGDNYLSSIAVQIMNDGLFNDVRDRSNANFLWFITFERRMSEMEQELQCDDKEVKQNVISMPNHTTESTQIDGDHKASVFFLDHFRAG
jgi:hypothetical protein